MHLEPAASVIKELGGAPVVAKHLGVNPTTVRRFQYPKERSGTGGFFPNEYIFPLLMLSVQIGKPIDLARMVLTPEQRSSLCSVLPASSSQTENASPRKSSEVTQ
jgi:hypothetical protein